MQGYGAMPGTTFFHQARNNAWSNHRLLVVCQNLTDQELNAQRTSFFPTILQVLNHNLVIDRYYLDALREAGRGRDGFADPTPFADIAKLAAAQRASDSMLIEFCQTLDEKAAMREVELDRGNGVSVFETVSAILSHLFVQQIHHRGQVHAMLCETAHVPPQLDKYHLDSDAEFRGTDFADLGWHGI